MENNFIGKNPPENVKKATCTIYSSKDETVPICDCYNYSEDIILPAINNYDSMLAALKDARDTLILTSLIDKSLASKNTLKVVEDAINRVCTNQPKLG